MSDGRLLGKLKDGKYGICGLTIVVLIEVVLQICREYSNTGDEYWKTNSYEHDEHPNAAFQQHLNGSKHKAAV